MATIRKLSIKIPDRISKQSDTDATIALIEFADEKFVQLDSVGSSDRKFVGKRSQSMRLTKQAFDQLVEIGSKYFNEKN
jgi:hypothetical protein